MAKEIWKVRKKKIQQGGRRRDPEGENRELEREARDSKDGRERRVQHKHKVFYE